MIRMDDSYLYSDTEHGSISLILEYMNGGSLQSMLTDGKLFSEDDAAVVAFSVLSALIDLHGKNILHRDIKPSNILADITGHIKLADFGINKGHDAIAIDLYIMSLLMFN
jgi:serine/threonine protein kinase